MNIMTIVIAVAIVVVAIVWLVSRRSGSGARPKRSQKHQATASLSDRSTTQWRAVKIEPGLISCRAAEKLADQVFLSKESPRLPLEDCSETGCRCKYVHLDDRRSGGDRRIELGDLGAYLPVSQTERRHIGGRRSADLAA